MKSINISEPGMDPKLKEIIKYNPFQKQQNNKENIKIGQGQESDIITAEWIEWSDLEVLRNIVGCWVMGERGAAYEFMKLELTMNETNGKNRKWRAQIQKGKNYDYGSEITNIYGVGHWRLTYPTSIYFRQNLHHICNYYIGYYKIYFMILSRDVVNIIADYTLGIGIRSLDLIQMQLILERESFRHTVTMDDNLYTFNGCDEMQDFSESFGLSLTNTMIDLLDYCINQVENKEENDLQNYDSFMKLDQFTDDEQDKYFDQYFHNEIK